VSLLKKPNQSRLIQMNINNRKNAGEIAFAVLSVLAASASAATEGSSSESWRTDEVVVTATRAPEYSVATAVTTRTPVPLVEVPQSVQVLNRQLLEDQGLTNLADALTNVAGVVPAKPMEVALEQPDIRGFVAEIAIDGLPAYGATAVVDSSSLVGVEQVEVAKGPTSLRRWSWCSRGWSHQCRDEISDERGSAFRFGARGKSWRIGPLFRHQHAGSFLGRHSACGGASASR
jgi:outer membrane receptor for monomeric catechols